MSGEDERLDVWWSKVFKASRYPVLSSLVRPYPSPFTGPMVKYSFSMIKFFFDLRSGRVEIDTSSAIMTAKLNIEPSKKSAAVKCSRKDIVRDPVNSELSYQMRTSSLHYKKRWKVKRDNRLSKRKNLVSKKEFVKCTNKKRKETVHHQVKHFFRYGYVFSCFVLLALCIVVLLTANQDIPVSYKTKD